MKRTVRPYVIAAGCLLTAGGLTVAAASGGLARAESTTGNASGQAGEAGRSRDDAAAGTGEGRTAPARTGGASVPGLNTSPDNRLGQSSIPPLWQIPVDLRFQNSGPLPAEVQDEITLYQPYVDQFAWRSFIAVNWPVKADGQPDTNRWIGAGGDARPVWESWINAEDVFRPGGAAPRPWGWGPEVPAACKGMAQKEKVTKVFSPGDRSGSTANEHGYDQQQDHTYIQTNDTGPLIDQKGRWVRYEVYLNKPAYDYIVQNGLYSRAGQAAFQAQGKAVSFPGDVKAADGTVSAGAIEIKAAWKVLDPGQEKRLHTARALFVNADGTCEAADVGLVGFHVASKTRYAPQRVWGTFEHIANTCLRAPSAPYPYLAGYFCNPSCVDHPEVAGCAPNQPPPKPWVPPAFPARASDTPPTQVQQVIPSEDSTRQINLLLQDFLGGVDPSSVWKYYQMVSTQWVMPVMSDLNTAPERQWLRNPQVDGKAPQYYSDMPVKTMGLIVPPFSANTTIETYTQSGSSCVGCHQGATTSTGQNADFAWVLATAQ